MGILDIFKKKERPSILVQADTMSAQAPFFTPFGDNIYASDIVLQSIRCKANEFKKLKPRHIRNINGKQVAEEGSNLSRVLNNPNEYMTTADFLEKITILLELTKNVFIYPVGYKTKGGEMRYTALYPLKPINVQYLQDEKGNLYIEMKFKNGTTLTCPAGEVIHWRKDYGVNDYFGGNVAGSDNAGLVKMLKEYDKLTQSIAKSLQVSCAINGIIKYNSYYDSDKLEDNRKEIEEKLKSNESGILFNDMSTEFTPLPRDVKLVDNDTLKFFYETILRANGTSLAILNGDYTKEQKEAYYEHALEADIKSLGQAMSKVLFTDREKGFGNEIVLYPNDISFMSMENKISALQTGLPAGIFTKNEARELLGYPPLPAEQGDVVPQGYNSALDDSNNNVIKGDKENEK